MTYFTAIVGVFKSYNQSTLSFSYELTTKNLTNDT